VQKKTAAPGGGPRGGLKAVIFTFCKMG